MYGYPAYIRSNRSEDDYREIYTNITFVVKCKRGSNKTDCKYIQARLIDIKKNNTDNEYDYQETIEEDYIYEPIEGRGYKDEHDNKMHTITQYLIIKNNTLLKQNYSCMLLAEYSTWISYVTPLDII
ncbi:SWPV1-203 [Shearwaterpox virus]|uniref:SWPV1-203 n=1 Tax=Shearwaterpox virus TaxID=1974596 RepID=A0A1V0S831_CNPV|nr:SWPV1-203 [Shearwaterpox virus]